MFMVVYSVNKGVHLPQPFASQREFIVTLPPSLTTFLPSKLVWELLEAKFYPMFAIIVPISVFSFFFFKNPALETDCA